jgi:hypothetical protein
MAPAMSRFFVSVAAACFIAAQPAPASAHVSGEALYMKRVAGGMVLIGSGYGRFGQVPGNVRVCLSVDGR